MHIHVTHFLILVVSRSFCICLYLWYKYATCLVRMLSLKLKYLSNIIKLLLVAWSNNYLFFIKWVILFQITTKHEWYSFLFKKVWKLCVWKKRFHIQSSIIVITYWCKEIYPQCASLTRGINPSTKLIKYNLVTRGCNSV